MGGTFYKIRYCVKRKGNRWEVGQEVMNACGTITFIVFNQFTSVAKAKQECLRLHLNQLKHSNFKGTE